MKKKILFAITKGNWGGAQKYVFDLATNLPPEDFDISVLCGAGDALETKLKEKNVPVVRLPSLDRDMNLAKDLQSFFDLYDLLKKEKPDIIHLNSSKIGGIGALAGRLAGVPHIIFTGHGWAWNEDRFFISKILITLAHWLTIVLAHKTIAVSEKVKQEIINLAFIPKSKVAVVYNGIQDTDYLERFAARAELRGDISEKFWVGTIAELHRNKGLDMFIGAFADALKEQPNTALVVIGEGEERKSLELLSENLGIEKKVHLLGFRKNASQFLKSFDVFVLPSRTEAFPYVILEAGLAQLPTIASKVGGIPEVITNDKNGVLVNPGDQKALSKAIIELIDDSTKAAMLGHNLRKTVEERFSVDSMVEKTIAVYNEVSN